MNLYSLLQSTQNSPDAPCINISVSLADLHQLVVDTIDATRDRLLPLFLKAEEDRLLTKKEVMEKFGVCHTTLWNWNKNKILIPVKVGKKVCYRQSDVERLILERDRK